MKGYRVRHTPSFIKSSCVVPPAGQSALLSASGSDSASETWRARTLSPTP